MRLELLVLIITTIIYGKKMAKDIGMTIRKGIVVYTILGCFLGIPSLYVLSFFFDVFFCYLFLLFFCGEEKGMNGV